MLRDHKSMWHEARIHGIERRAKSYPRISVLDCHWPKRFLSPVVTGINGHASCASIIGGRFVRSSHHQHWRLLNILDFFSLSRFVDSYTVHWRRSIHTSQYTCFRPGLKRYCNSWRPNTQGTTRESDDTYLASWRPIQREGNLAIYSGAFRHMPRYQLLDPSTNKASRYICSFWSDYIESSDRIG